MDKTEKIILDELTKDRDDPQLDVDSVIRGVQTRIHKRAIRRKTLYSTPIVILLVLMVFVSLPDESNDKIVPGGELLMAGWEDSWTESQNVDSEQIYEEYLYEQSVDYLTDEQYFSYTYENDELLDDNDIEAFISYLEEV